MRKTDNHIQFDFIEEIYQALNENVLALSLQNNVYDNVIDNTSDTITKSITS